MAAGFNLALLQLRKARTKTTLSPFVAQRRSAAEMNAQQDRWAGMAERAGRHITCVRLVQALTSAWG